MIHGDTLLSDVVLEEPSTVTVLNRFGIFLGLGDKTVSQACNEADIDTQFFITILNTYTNQEYFPEKTLSAFSIELLVDYLNKTNDYYRHYLLPNIERHFNLLLNRSEEGKSNINVICRFFEEVKMQLLDRISCDTDSWFPALLHKVRPSASDFSDTDYELKSDDFDSVEDKIDDLINMMIIHLRGEYDHYLCYAVLSAIFSLQKDISNNNRIRERILRPISIELKNN